MTSFLVWGLSYNILPEKGLHRSCKVDTESPAALSRLSDMSPSLASLAAASADQGHRHGGLLTAEALHLPPVRGLSRDPSAETIPTLGYVDPQCLCTPMSRGGTSLQGGLR